ncbi:MAG TPA: sulfite exporter TauE/SafE family protein [Gammaproteobacteria bacterium]|nr:sulfite exporter TauE/SafE family protein [Gammaproteobacteria bacterium]
MIYLLLMTAGCIAWIISTIAAGGAATLLIPVIGLLLGPQLVAPVISVASIMANPSRVLFFHDHIDWVLVRWLVPGSVLGAILGAWLFTQLQIEWLEIVLGLFLVSYVLQYRFSKKRLGLVIKPAWFFPIGILVSFLSGLTGATGPILNPFLLSYGLQKQQLVGTKAVNSFIMQITKLSTYTIFGALTLQIGIYGIALGLGAIIGVYLTHLHLLRINTEQFTLYVHLLMFVSGCLMLGRVFF